MFYLLRTLFHSRPHILTDLLILLFSFLFLHTLDTNLLSDVQLLTIFSNSEDLFYSNDDVICCTETLVLEVLFVNCWLECLHYQVLLRKSFPLSLSSSVFPMFS